MAIIISLGVTQVIYENKTYLAFTFLLLFCLQITALTSSFKSVFRQNYNHSRVHHQIMSHIPKGSRVLAPWPFIYNEIGNYQIVSEKNIEYYNYQKVDSVELKSIIDKLDVEYIVANNLLFDFT
mgnify:CR=1 FL=1